MSLDSPSVVLVLKCALPRGTDEAFFTGTIRYFWFKFSASRRPPSCKPGHLPDFFSAVVGA